MRRVDAGQQEDSVNKSSSSERKKKGNAKRSTMNRRDMVLCRSNSFGGFSAKQSDRMAATIQLFLYYQQEKNGAFSIDEFDHDLSVMQLKQFNTVSLLPAYDNKFNSTDRNISSGVLKRRKLFRNQIVQPVTVYPSFLDPPTSMPKIHSINKWEFDIFALRKLSSTLTVCNVGLRIMEEHNLFRLLNLDHLMMARIFSAIEGIYRNYNPYHTALHAADVLQAIHCFIHQSKLQYILEPAEIFGGIIAALCHDADHPGVNQIHLQKTGNFLVTLYQSDSVLEKHHSQIGLSILHENGLAKVLKPADWVTVRNILLKVIPATDIVYQSLYRQRFTDFMQNRRCTNTVYNQDEKILLLQMALKCADISNPCRPWGTCQKWAKRVCTELFCQGDRERMQWSLKPMLLMDRNKISIPQIQVGFIQDVVRPLLLTWHEFFQNNLTHNVTQILNSNYENWFHLLQQSDKPNEQIVKYNAAINNNNNKDEHNVQLCNFPSNHPSIKPNKTMKKGYRTVKLKAVFEQDPKLDIKQPFITAVHLSANQDSQLGEEDEITNNTNQCESTNETQTLFITTSGIRRHSLPETQLAIKKTFNLSMNKTHQNQASTIKDSLCGSDKLIPTEITNPITTNPNHEQQQHQQRQSLNDDNIQLHQINNNNKSVKYKLAKQKHLNTNNRKTNQLTTVRTTSANIFQTLCGEILYNNNNHTKWSLNTQPVVDTTTTTNTTRTTTSATDTWYCKDQLTNLINYTQNNRNAGIALTVGNAARVVDTPLVRFANYSQRRGSAPIT